MNVKGDAGYTVCGIWILAEINLLPSYADYKIKEENSVTKAT